MNVNEPIRDQLAVVGDGIDSLLRHLNNNKYVLGWVCGAVRELKWDFGDAPSLNGLLGHGRRDVEEVNAIRLVRISCKEISPLGLWAPARGPASQGHLAEVHRNIRWVGPLAHILPA